MLKIILGRNGSGKTTKILNLIDTDIRSGKKAYLMVPEQLTLSYEKLATEFFKKPLFFCKIMSFDRISSDIILNVGGQNEQYIDEVSKLALLYKALDNNKDNFTIYNSSLNKNGFLQKSLKLIDNLKLNDISAGTLEQASKDKTISNDLSTKLSEIANMYRLLENSLSGKFIDNGSRLKFTTQKIPEYINRKNFTIYFDAYISFTALELNFITALLNLDKDVTITLPFSELNDTSFEIARDTFRQLNKICEENNIKFETEELKKSFIKKEDLHFLETNFGLIGSKKYAKEPENIFLYTFDNPQTEIDYIANKIRGLVKDKNIKYSDICVAVTNLDGYTEPIRKFFTLYEIPFFLDLKRSLTGENIINLIFSFLSAFDKGLNYKNTLSILKTGFLDVDKSDIDLLDNFMYKWSISERPYISEKYFTEDKYFLGEFEESKADIQKIYYLLTDIYKKYKNIFTKNTTSSQFSSSLIDFLNDLNAQEKIELEIENLKNEYPQIAGEISQSWNVLVDTLTKMDAAFSEEKIDLDAYQKMLSLCIDAQKISIIPPTVDSVTIIDINSSKYIGSKILFACGMSNTLIPTKSETDIFLHEKEKQALKNLNINLNNDSSYYQKMEQASLYTLLAGSSDKLYFSYAITDINQSSADSSIYIEKIKSIFPLLKTSGLITHKDLDEIAFDYDKDFANNLTLKSGIYHLFKILPEIVKKLDTNENKEIAFNNSQSFINMMNFLNYIKENDKLKNYYETVKNSTFRKNDYHTITEQSTKQIYNLPISTSVSELQSFASCPFSHFMNYLIHPQSKESVYIDSLASGSLLHKYMENFTKQMILKNKKIEQMTKDSVDKLVDKIYNSEEFLDNTSKIIISNSKKQLNILNNLKKISAKATDFMIKEQNAGQYNTTAAEYSIKPIKLVIDVTKGDDLGTIYLHGKIDRLDTINIDDERYIRIIDYKSSKKSINLGEIVDGTNIQLVFYLYALENLGAGTAYAAMYLPMINAYESLDANSLDEIEKKLQDQLKMKGIVVNDKDIYQKFELIEGDKSEFSDVTIKGDDLKGSSVVSKNQMKQIMDMVISSITSLSKDMLNGNIEPCPVGNTCDYCQYKSICKIDSRTPGYRKKRATKLSLNDLNSDLGGEKNE